MEQRTKERWQEDIKTPECGFARPKLVTFQQFRNCIHGTYTGIQKPSTERVFIYFKTMKVKIQGAQ